MLYVTTRVSGDAYTANRALSENRGPEGGFFVPMRMPRYSEAELLAMADKSFAQNMAELLNRLFNTQLDSWAVEFGVGRYPVKLAALSPRVTVAEMWHNPEWRFSRLAAGTEKAIRQSDEIVGADWVVLASRIAALFATFGQLLKNGTVKTDAPIDVVVPSGNFSAPMAVWYARAWGLPIANIVVCCNENSGVWSLLHRGELRTDAAAVKTGTPACDFTVPTDLERLIFSTLGAERTAEFVSVCGAAGRSISARPIKRHCAPGCMPASSADGGWNPRSRISIKATAISPTPIRRCATRVLPTTAHGLRRTARRSSFRTKAPRMPLSLLRAAWASPRRPCGHALTRHKEGTYGTVCNR